MNPDEAVELMASSRDGREWDGNVDRVKAAHGGELPEWWDDRIVHSGIKGEATMRFIREFGPGEGRD
jgi:hypothetical protein